MLALLKSLHEDAVGEVRTLEIKEGFAVAVKMAALKNQLNFAELLCDLPNVLQQIVERDERIKSEIEKFKASQEGGTI